MFIKFVVDGHKTLLIPSGGSLGSWIDEERSWLRYKMRIADTLSIDILNAHGGDETLIFCRHVFLRAALVRTVGGGGVEC